MVDQALEHGRLEQAQLSGLREEVPDDARAVCGGGHGLLVVRGDLDAPDTTSMLLQRGVHRLRLEADVPDPHLALHASRDDASAIGGQGEGCNTILVRIIDCVEQLAALREKGADLAIGPARDDRLAIPHEVQAEAFHVGHLDAEQLLSRHSIPDSDVRHRARRKDFGVVSWEGHLVDALVVASISQLCREGVSVNPVDVRQRSATEEVRPVHCKRHRSHAAKDLALLLYTEALCAYSRQRAVACADDDVAIRKHCGGCDSQGKGLARPTTRRVLLEQCM
mmetsp:Transcript_40690/g.75730  ORF Transcript_40690/g.75730 Transcript_40690/m.75730 type:complete len:280 (+) Transcript_40690:464-1303(+)